MARKLEAAGSGADLATKADLRDLEQRMTIKIGAMLVALAGFLAVIKVFG